MDEAAKQKLLEALDAQFTPFGKEHLFKLIDSLLTEAQAAALAMAADAASQDAQVIVTSLGNIETVMAESAPESFCGKVSQDFERTMKAAMRVNKRILALSPLDVARYIERVRLAELIAARKVTCLTCSYGDKDDVGRKVYTRFHKEWGWQHQYNRQGWFGCDAIPIRELEADFERQLAASAEVKK